MAEEKEKRSSVTINRALVLTLWAAVVAGMLGFDQNKGNVGSKTTCKVVILLLSIIK